MLTHEMAGPVAWEAAVRMPHVHPYAEYVG
jgi:hypothetical protein